jgi:hypothetical protein
MPEAPEADELYQIPPDQFTAARNALAASLKKEGRKAEADEVKRLRRPSLTAWALNQVARQRPSSVAAVLSAGELLRDAMQAALGGDASGLRRAQTAQRQAIDGALGAAGEILEASGHPISETARQRMAGTLHAAMVDEGVAGLLQAGTLDEDREAPGFGLDAEALPASAARASGKAAAGGTRSSGGRAAGAVAGGGSAGAAGEDSGSGSAGVSRADLTAARKAEEERRRQARARLAELESEADRLTRRATRLRGEAEEATSAAAQALAAADQAEAEAEAARRRLEEDRVVERGREDV